ncbi:hypothetical protein D9601_16825 [Sphingomonas sp. MA1305]|nr:hypothetical protein [Sphingomonas sp. MA1305]
MATWPSGTLSAPYLTALVASSWSNNDKDIAVRELIASSGPDSLMRVLAKLDSAARATTSKSAASQLRFISTSCADESAFRRLLNSSTAV